MVGHASTIESSHQCTRTANNPPEAQDHHRPYVVSQRRPPLITDEHVPVERVQEPSGLPWRGR
eukprot:5325988-Amphidinium_carterae.1